MAVRPRILKGGGIGGETSDDKRFAIANRPSDVRAEAVVSANREHEWLRERTREVLENATRERFGDDQIEQVLDDLIAVRTHARDSIVAAIETGRLLRRIQEHVGPKGYKGLVQAGLAYVRENMASTYRKIAEVVDTGLVPLERMPSAVRPAYDLARLDPPILELVAERVQLGPATTAREIRQALDQVRAEAGVTLEPANLDRLKSRIRELERQRGAALERARQLEAQIATARAQLEALNPKHRAHSRQAA